MDVICSVEFLKEKVLPETKIALVVGSGLSGIVKKMEETKTISYSEIPGFLQSTHYYEGYEIQEITEYIKVLKLLGIETIILTNASGSMKEEIKPGDLVVIEDHINLSGLNPLRGKNDESFGPRFVDMSNAYSKDLIQKVLGQNGDFLHKGNYVFTTGPSFETAAEIKAFRMLGGDIVGMSTVPEVIMSAYCGLQTLAISCVSNYATGILGSNVSDEELERVTGLAQDKFSKVIEGLFMQL